MTGWAAKRFWTDTRVAETADGYAVFLDDRPLRTPGKAPLSLPTHALAESVAAEWARQERAVDPASMPMTRMANSAIDKVTPQRSQVAAYVTAYGETDLLCYRAGGPEALAALQSEAWDPPLKWASDALGVRLQVTAGVMPVTQDPAMLGRLAGIVDGYDAFGLTALHDLVSLSGSLVLGLAATRGAFEIGDIWQRSRIDEQWQIDQWGADDEAGAVAERRRAAFADAFQFFRNAQILS